MLQTQHSLYWNQLLNLNNMYMYKYKLRSTPALECSTLRAITGMTSENRMQIIETPRESDNISAFWQK